MAKKVEAKEMHIEKQSTVLANRVTDTEAQLQALDSELVVIDQQHQALAGAEEIDLGAVQSLQTRRQMVLAEQTTLQLRVGALKEQQKAAEIAEGTTRLAEIERLQLVLAGEIDEACTEGRELVHDILSTVEKLRERLRTRNELSAEAGYWAVKCDVPRSGLPMLAPRLARVPLCTGPVSGGVPFPRRRKDPLC